MLSKTCLTSIIFIFFFSLYSGHSQNVQRGSTTYNSESSKADLIPKIITIQEKDNEIIVTINKGLKTKTQGGKPRIGDEYTLLIPQYSNYTVTNKKVIKKLDKIGTISIIQTEFDTSIGILRLGNGISDEILKKESILKKMTDKKGTEFEIGSDFGLLRIFNKGYQGGVSRGIYGKVGYHYNRFYYTGLGIGIYKANFDIYIGDFHFEDLIFVPIYASTDIVFSKHFFRPFLTCNLGSYLFKKIHDPAYDDYYFKGLYSKTGLGLKFNITSTYGVSFLISYQTIGHIGYYSGDLAWVNTISTNLSFFF